MHLSPALPALASPDGIAPRRSTTAIAAQGLRLSYGDLLVLDGIDLSVPSGSVFALLGPNGSGKTTTVKILSTLLAADDGTASVLGHDVRIEADAVRRTIGVTGQFAAVDAILTGEQNLLLMARLRHLRRADGRRRAAELLDRFELTEAAGRLTSTYSGGMRRRLDIAMTLIGDPRLIFLDEPTTGLDPRSRQVMWDIVGELVDDGVTVFLTTQYLEEADRLADRVAVLDHGRVVAEGTTAELKRRVPGAHVRVRFTDADDLQRAAHTIAEGVRDDEACELRVPIDGDARSIRTVLGRLDERLEIEDLSINTPTLDDVFFALTAPGADRGEVGR